MFYESILQVAEFIRLPPAFERCVSLVVLRRPYPEAKIRMQSVCLLACQYAVFDHLFQGTPTSFQLSSFQNLPKRPRGDVGIAPYACLCNLRENVQATCGTSQPSVCFW